VVALIFTRVDLSGLCMIFRVWFSYCGVSGIRPGGCQGSINFHPSLCFEYGLHTGLLLSCPLLSTVHIVYAAYGIVCCTVSMRGTGRKLCCSYPVCGK
jgi:hypothetical protein